MAQKNPDEKRTVRREVSLSPAEDVDVRAAAQRRGLDVNTFIRMAAVMLARKGEEDK